MLVDYLVFIQSKKLVDHVLFDWKNAIIEDCISSVATSCANQHSDHLYPAATLVTTLAHHLVSTISKERAVGFSSLTEIISKVNQIKF